MRKGIQAVDFTEQQITLNHVIAHCGRNDKRPLGRWMEAVERQAHDLAVTGWFDMARASTGMARNEGPSISAQCD